MKHTKPKIFVLSLLGGVALVALWVACSKTIPDKDTGARRSQSPTDIISPLPNYNQQEEIECVTCLEKDKEDECVGDFLEKMSKKYKCWVMIFDQDQGKVCVSPCSEQDIEDLEKFEEGEKTNNTGLSLPLEPK